MGQSGVQADNQSSKLAWRQFVGRREQLCESSELRKGCLRERRECALRYRLQRIPRFACILCREDEFPQLVEKGMRGVRVSLPRPVDCEKRAKRVDEARLETTSEGWVKGVSRVWGDRSSDGYDTKVLVGRDE